MSARAEAPNGMPLAYMHAYASLLYCATLHHEQLRRPAH